MKKQNKDSANAKGTIRELYFIADKWSMKRYNLHEFIEISVYIIGFDILCAWHENQTAIKSSETEP